MPATKKGIYHNLKESKYTVSNTETVFFFSSKLYMMKFMDGYEQNRKIFFQRMAKIVGRVPLNLSTLADISFYQTVEKRGFRAMLKGVDITETDLYQYSLRKMTQNVTPDWKVITAPRISERKYQMRRPLMTSQDRMFQIK